MTANVKGTEVPAATVDGKLVNEAAVAVPSAASVPEKTCVEPVVMTTVIFAQMSEAVPFVVPLVPRWQVPAGKSLNVEAASEPVFLIETEVVTVVPGVICVLPPNLLIDVHDAFALLLETVEAGELVHVALPLVSSMSRVPVAAVFCEFVMLAENADSVPDMVRATSDAATRPVTRASGVVRRRARARWDEVIGDPCFRSGRMHCGPDSCDRAGPGALRQNDRSHTGQLSQ